jgi:pyrimidine-specific ribonucleoside hydrolase
MRKPLSCVPIFCAIQVASAHTVWIDTDVSIVSPIREVDDAFALVLAFHSPEIRIAGVSTTYGNASLGATTRAAQDVVGRFGHAAGLAVDHVFAGAASPSNLGRRSAASEALAAAMDKQKITYIALGPLTNLATFLQLHPPLAHRIERVIFVGGQASRGDLAFGPNRSFHIHDANVFKDSTATTAVLRSGIPLTLAPIATGSGLTIDRADLRELERSGDAGQYLSSRSRIWLWFWTNFVKTKGGPIFDALAIIPATRPELLSIEMRYAKMDEAANLVVTTRRINGARPVRYCTRFTSATKRFVLDRLMTRE